MMAATSSPKKLPRGQPKSYSTCLLYNTKEATEKLKGLMFAACNPKLEKNVMEEESIENDKKPLEEPGSIIVSDKMLCSLCDIVFVSRSDQKSHYKSDWHRYNIKQRLKGKLSVSEEAFDEISGNVSSISGSDSDSDLDYDVGRSITSADLKSRPKPGGLPTRLTTSGNTSTDSESESGPSEDAAQRLPKVYFRTAEGELISIYRCVLCHKKWQPTKQTDLLSLAEELPEHMMWAVFMSGGGHFAGAIFNRGNLVAHKTFHRYVVRAKRGTAQGSRDSQGGNAPKSAGASLRRYNEAALTQDIQDLITSWDEHIKSCDKIFLRAPSFNRKIFFGGKSPPFKKDDMRIRLIPFQTRRPTFNEIRRVYELLASVECYGEESEIQDFIPISPPQVYDAETGQLAVRDENQLSPRRRKLKNKLLSASPLVGQDQDASSRDGSETEMHTSEGARSRNQMEELKGKEPETKGSFGQENMKLPLPDHMTENQNSTGTSTASESELVEQLETINLLELKEYAATKKPKRRKKQSKKRKNSLRCQKSPESNVFEEEKYHLKNNLYTACKVGDMESLRNLLVIFSVQFQNQSQKETGTSCDTKTESLEQTEIPCGENNPMVTVTENQDSVNFDSDYIGNKISENVVETEALEKDMDILKETCSIDSEVTSTVAKVSIGNNSETQCDMCVSEENVTDNLVIHSDSKEMKNAPLTKSEALKDHTTKSILIDKETNVTSDSFKDKTTIGVVGLNSKTDKFNDSEGNECMTTMDASIKEKSNMDAVDERNLDATDGLPNNDNQPSKSNILDHSKIASDTTAFIDSVKEEDSVNVNEKRHMGAGDNQTVDTGTIVADSSPLQLNKPAKVQVTGNLSDLSPVVTVDLLNETFGDNETTLLHVAAREGHKDIVTALMAAGSDPAVRDRAGLTPYMVSKDKPTRNEFRKFMGQWPEKFDYARAQIPPPISEEQENERKRKEAERKKAQKKAKQERQKEKKAEEAVRDAEEREKKRYLGLSDREKRGLAAERRLLDQASREGAGKPVLSRCWQCGEDMTGKVPFEYMEYKFCTSKCLQLHRKQKSSKS